MLPPKLRSPISRATLWIILGWVTATLVGLMVVGVRTSTADKHTTSSRGADLAGLSFDHPLLGGQEVPLGEASAAVGFRVPVPDTSVASQSNLTAVWVAASRNQVALIFDRGNVTITLEPATYQDPISEYQTFISENNAQAAIVKVNGLSALVINPGTDAAKSNPAWIELDLNGTDVNVFSASYGTDQLLEVAGSLAQATASPTPSSSASNSSSSTELSS